MNKIRRVVSSIKSSLNHFKSCDINFIIKFCFYFVYHNFSSSANCPVSAIQNLNKTTTVNVVPNSYSLIKLTATFLNRLAEPAKNKCCKVLHNNFNKKFPAYSLPWDIYLYFCGVTLEKTGEKIFKTYRCRSRKLENHRKM